MARNHLFIGATALLFLWEASMSGATDMPKDAVRLVNAMELNRAALLAVQVPYLVSQQQNKEQPISNDEKRLLSCLQSLDPSVYMDINVAEVLKQMSMEEIRQAILFFESAAGKKLNKNGFIQLREAFNLPSNEKVQEFSAGEQADIERFQKTSAGNKLLSQNILSSNSVRQQMLKRNEEVIHSCKKDSKSDR